MITHTHPFAQAHLLAQTQNLAVFVVDDDPKLRESLRWLLESADLTVETFASAEEFWQNYDRNRVGCLVLDICMPGMTGLELQAELAAEELPPPIIFLTGHGAVSLAVRAMKLGAVDFLEKPFEASQLLDRVRTAMDQHVRQRQARAGTAGVSRRLGLLSAREKQVLDLVVAGRTNKEIAVQLGVSHRTVENHRARILTKMQADTSLDLVRMVLLVQKERPHPAALQPAGAR